MRMRLANWFRSIRLSLAEKIMDKRDRDVLVECRSIIGCFVMHLGWKFINELRNGECKVVIEDVEERIH